MGFTLLTVFLFLIFYSRKREYKTFTFENLENVNIYNALKPSEINKIYEENERSPIEQIMMNSKGIFNNIKLFNIFLIIFYKILEHQEYKDKKLHENVTKKFSIASNFGVINDVPKTDLKKRFNNSIKNLEEN